MEWQQVRKKGITEVRPYVEGEPLTDVSMQPGASPQPGDMIARDPDNHNDQWLIAKDFFVKNYEYLDPYHDQKRTVPDPPQGPRRA